MGDPNTFAQASKEHQGCDKTNALFFGKNRGTCYKKGCVMVSPLKVGVSSINTNDSRKDRFGFIQALKN